MIPSGRSRSAFFPLGASSDHDDDTGPLWIHLKRTGRLLPCAKPCDSDSTTRMLYIVGGCSRSGTSTLAERMRVRHGVPWFPLDALKMGLHLGAPSLGVHPGDDDLQTADVMWPIIKGVLEHLEFDGRDFLFEGVNLRPSTLSKFMAELNSPIRACFLGFPQASIEVKAAQLAQHIGPSQEWLHRRGPDNVNRCLKISRSLSKHLKSECSDLKIPFIDTGEDFEAGLQKAESILTSP